jgi:hypothetical protein
LLDPFDKGAIQQAGGGPNDLLTAPHSVPKNRGAAMMEVPRRR